MLITKNLLMRFLRLKSRIMPLKIWETTGFRIWQLNGDLVTPGFSNGAAYGDLDNDGDLDLVVNNVNMPMSIYRNETNHQLPDNHYLKVILKGEAGNTQAIGAKVTVKNKGKFVYLEQMPMRGYLSTVDPRPNLGSGSFNNGRFTHC